MSQRRSTVYSDTVDLATVGTVSMRAGKTVVVTLSMRAGKTVVVTLFPLVAGTFAGLVADAGTPAVGLERALMALTQPLFVGTGLPSLFHAGALGLFVGCWLCGLGLVLDGLSE